MNSQFGGGWGRRVKDSNLTERMMNSEDVILHPKTREALEKLLTSKGES
ncbi:hypothetical protein [Paenibacillus xylanexedens]|nr:hypothetical protein [Paenibacillus xylanexedens]